MHICLTVPLLIAEKKCSESINHTLDVSVEIGWSVSKTINHRISMQELTVTVDNVCIIYCTKSSHALRDSHTAFSVNCIEDEDDFESLALSKVNWATTRHRVEGSVCLHQLLGKLILSNYMAESITTVSTQLTQVYGAKTSCMSTPCIIPNTMAYRLNLFWVKF